MYYCFLLTNNINPVVRVIYLFISTRMFEKLAVIFRPTKFPEHYWCIPDGDAEIIAVIPKFRSMVLKKARG
jgi:hypothetical protein